jgi:hypothetical protein
LPFLAYSINAGDARAAEVVDLTGTDSSFLGHTRDVDKLKTNEAFLALPQKKHATIVNWLAAYAWLLVKVVEGVVYDMPPMDSSVL